MITPPEPDLEQLRLIIGRARVQAGMTVDQLAEASGISRQTILNLSAGRYFGDLKTWLKLAYALDTGMDELLSPVWGDGPRPGRRQDEGS